jgi:glutamate carboxypeptidase
MAMTRVTLPQVRPSWKERLKYFETRLDGLVESIRELVEIESPSDSKPAIDEIAAFLGERFRTLGGQAQILTAKIFGNNLQVDFPGRENRKPVLLLGHYDTVYPLGTLAAMPYRLADGRMYGPGVLDMKSGIALMMAAIAALQE